MIRSHFGSMLARSQVCRPSVVAFGVAVPVLQICNFQLAGCGCIASFPELRVDDDQDAIWMKVNIGKGASCHVGYISCFFRSVPLGKIKNSKKIKMKFKEIKKKFDPKKVYKGQPNPTKL